MTGDLKRLKTEFTELLVELYGADVPEDLIHKLTKTFGALYRAAQKGERVKQKGTDNA